MDEPTDPISQAIEGSKQGVLAWLNERWPNAFAFTVYREHDHGHWYNSSPTMLDDHARPLTESDDGWDDEFYHSPVVKDWEFWLNNSDRGSETSCFTMDGEEHDPPPRKPYRGEPLARFAIFQQPVKAGQTVRQLKDGELKGWFANLHSNTVLQVFSTIDGEISEDGWTLEVIQGKVDDDHIISENEKIEFVRRMKEKGATASVG